MVPRGEDKKPLVSVNPVDGLDTSIIGNTKSKKAPLNIAMIDHAAAVSRLPIELTSIF
jgi:hypothetical protein